MPMSNGLHTKIKNALAVGLALGPDYIWRAFTEELSGKERIAFLLWAKEQIDANPQPHTTTTAG